VIVVLFTYFFKLRKDLMKMENSYKSNIIDFIEGRQAPDEFLSLLEHDPKVFDWLQSVIPQGKTFSDMVNVKLDHFLSALPQDVQTAIYAAYHNLCAAIDTDAEDKISLAKKVVELLSAVDKSAFNTEIVILLMNMDKVLGEPKSYKPQYVCEMVSAVKELFERTYTAWQENPYDVRKVCAYQKSGSKIWTQVNIQGWLYHLMTEIFPDENIIKDETLYEKAKFLRDVCPDYIGGTELEEAEIIESIVSQVPENIPVSKRKKQIKELIKKEFHVSGTKYPRWIQGEEWPLSVSGKPMRFIEQKRKKGKGYDNMLFTVYVFEDTETGEIREIEQFT